MKAPAKLSFFVWLCLHNALPTNAFCHARRLALSLNCAKCFVGVKDVIHGLRDCSYSRCLWEKMGFSSSMNFFNLELKAWLEAHLKNDFNPSFLTTL